jgi:hypothetical protein
MNEGNEGMRALWFIVVFLIALAIFSNLSTFFLLMMLILAGMWVARNVNVADLRQNLDTLNQHPALRDDYDYDDDYEDEEDDRPIKRETVYRHALIAVENAGLDPDTVKVLAVDLGVVAFRADGTPAVYRTWTVPEDARSIQPFVTLRLPTSAVGRIRFEIIDAGGKRVFHSETDHRLEAGHNFITPPARLSLREYHNMDGRWQLRISADDVLLAVHRFEFAEPTAARIRQSLGEDGEIRADSRLLLDESTTPRMSLDDLLAYQQDEEQKTRRG